MQKLAFIFLFMVAAFLFGAPADAFAHQSHHHASQATNAALTEMAVVDAAPESTLHFGQTVSAAEDARTGKCPHGHGLHGDGCCACGGHASAAINVGAEDSHRLPPSRLSGESIAPGFIRDAVSDLTRPPKTFA